MIKLKRKKKQLAINLLKDRTCYRCKYYEFYNWGDTRSMHLRTVYKCTFHDTEPPEEKTCSEWFNKSWEEIIV